MSALAGVDWQRVAAPQADHYDTLTALGEWRRRGVDIAALQERNRARGAPAFMLEGRVAVTHVRGARHERFADAVPDHPHIACAEAYLARLPAVHAQFGSLIHTFHPWHDKLASEDSAGSSSHSLDALPGVVFGTVNDPCGLAQAFVHELAHTKLRAIGIRAESCDGFILNAPDELFESPIRKDKKRPMTAVFHAQYSFIYVCAVDIANLHAAADDVERSRWRVLLGRNVPRMLEGDCVLREHLRLDSAGAALMAGFFAWSEAVLAEGMELLDARREVVA